MEEEVVDKDFEDLKPNDNFKIKLAVIGGLAIIILLGVLVTIKGKDPLVEAQKSNYQEINVEKFYELYKSSDKFVLILGRPDCVHCENFKPVIKKYAKERNIRVYYMDVYNIMDESDFDFIWGLVNQEETPAMGVIENQQLIDSVSGEMTSEELDLWFRSVGVI